MSEPVASRYAKPTGRKRHGVIFGRGRSDSLCWLHDCAFANLIGGCSGTNIPDERVTEPVGSAASVGGGEGVVVLLLDLVPRGGLPGFDHLVVVAHRIAAEHDVVQTVGPGLLGLFTGG
jgi:hypothetical protein